MRSLALIWCRFNAFMARFLTVWSEWHIRRAIKTAKAVERFRIQQQWRETHRDN
jgi:hypothetical protein